MFKPLPVTVFALFCGSALNAQPYAYVSSVAGGTVTVVNTANSTVVTSIAVPLGPSGIAVTPDGSAVYVASKSVNSVSVINTSSNSVVATIGVCSTPTLLAITPNGAQTYVACQGSGQVAAIDNSSKSVIGYLGVGSKPGAVAFSHDSTVAFVTDLLGGVFIVDTASRSVTGSFNAGSGPSAVAVSPDNRSVWVANQSSNTVTVHDLTGNLQATVGVGSFPNALAFTPNGGRVLVTNANSGSVSVIDTNSKNVVATIGTGTLPTSVAFSADGSHAYVTNEYAFSVSVIDVNGMYVANTMSRVAPYPFAIALAPAASPAPPALVSINPINGTGASQVFTATFSEPNGVADINWVGLLFNSSLNGAQGCYAVYVPAANGLYLLSDSGSGFLPGVITPGTAGTLSNSQCTIGNAGNATLSGTTLTIPVAITFSTTTFGGTKNVYAFAFNYEGAYSSLQAAGAWTTAAAVPPTVVSVNPINGSGSPVTFSATFGEQNGVADLSVLYLLFNTSLTGSNGCMVVYLPGLNSVYLINDAGNGFVTGSFAPGAAGSLSNSQCTVTNAGGVSVAGPNLTLPLTITFAGGFSGTKTVYGYALNKEGGASNWQTMGSWH